jgi:hypothetical protein
MNDDKSPSQLIDARIKELDDWCGRSRSRTRELDNRLKTIDSLKINVNDHSINAATAASAASKRAA